MLEETKRHTARRQTSLSTHSGKWQATGLVGYLKERPGHGLSKVENETRFLADWQNWFGLCLGPFLSISISMLGGGVVGVCWPGIPGSWLKIDQSPAERGWLRGRTHSLTHAQKTLTHTHTHTVAGRCVIAFWWL